MKIKSKVLMALAASVIMAGTAYADRAAVYISPNNDGIQDALTVPLRIREKRYISEWNFTILNSSGEVVRVIGNKEKREERITFKNFFKQLFSPKQGVDIPAEVTWNGYCDDGSLAPDGVYYYQFSATDDNGNTATTSKFIVVVDNTAPAVKIGSLSDSDKTFGEGAKTVLRINQSGSREPLWTASIFDSTTRDVVKTFKWENAAPVSIEWDGSDDTGVTVPDGIYTYEITSTDRAGNTAEVSQITNIIYSAEKPVINIAITGSRYFSPNGDNVNDSVTLSLSVPEPVSKNNHLVSWNVTISDQKGNPVRSFSGENNPPREVVFNGTDDTGKAPSVTAGSYVAKITARYLNGYEPTPVESPVFYLDNIVPEALLRVSDSVFNGSGNLEISQRVVSEEPEWTGKKTWTGKIVSESGTVVRQFNFGDSLPETVLWNGFNDSGSLAQDATYYYVVTGTELAGNTGTYTSTPFTLDTSKTELALSSSPQAFSPRLGMSETFSIAAKASSGIDSYALVISDSTGNAVKTFSGEGSLPSSISWNGTSDGAERCRDGVYTASLRTVAKSGTEAITSCQPFVIDTEAPSVSISVPYTLFSPDGISSKQTVPVAATSSVESAWTAVIKDSASRTVKTFSWQNDSVKNFAWDGTDDNGNKVPNGTYSLTVSSTDQAGNTGSASIGGIKVDLREVKAYITADQTGISPNQDGIKESQKFTVMASVTDGISAWSFTIVDITGKVVTQWTDSKTGSLPTEFIWAGDTVDAAGNPVVADGTFRGKLHIEYEKGNVVDAESSSFICTALPPQLDVQTVTEVSRVYFSPDNDGVDDDLYIRLRRTNNLAALKNWSFTIYDRNNNPFWATSGKSTITERIIWDGKGSNGELVQSAEDYTYVFAAEDELGMSNSVNGVIHVDVLIVRDGNKLKIQVPSIIFRSDNADFLTKGEKDSSGRVLTAGITLDQKANNEQILRRIAEILDKFKDYRVTIVGHANRLTDNPDEETVDNSKAWGPALIPLSLARAEYVKNILVSYGIGADRLSVDGKGGTEPVADTKDKSVNWKNRRVEFILEK